MTNGVWRDMMVRKAGEKIRMNDKELIGKIHSAIYHQCQRRGYAAPVDVMMEIGVLPKQKYEDWRFGRVDYLERVCHANPCGSVKAETRRLRGGTPRTLWTQNRWNA